MCSSSATRAGFDLDMSRDEAETVSKRSFQETTHKSSILQAGDDFCGKQTRVHGGLRHGCELPQLGRLGEGSSPQRATLWLQSISEWDAQLTRKELNPH